MMVINSRIVVFFRLQIWCIITSHFAGLLSRTDIIGVVVVTGFDGRVCYLGAASKTIKIYFCQSHYHVKEFQPL